MCVWFIVDVHNVVAHAVVEQIIYVPVVGPVQFQVCGVLPDVVVVFVVAAVIVVDVVVALFVKVVVDLVDIVVVGIVVVIVAVVARGIVVVAPVVVVLVASGDSTSVWVPHVESNMGVAWA